MENKLYVSNLSFTVLDESLRQEFTAFGTVSSAKVMVERDTGRSRGFGFVEMATDEQAQAAIQALNGKYVDGRAINVSVARPREPRAEGERSHAPRARW